MKILRLWTLEKAWSAHFSMENPQEPVQKVKKRRSQSDKIGRLKYNQQLLKRVLSEIAEVKLMQRTIFASLKGFFRFEQPMIEKIACSDEIDREILQALFEAGSPGMLPKDLAVKLVRLKVTRHQISRRILRMNKRLKKELGEPVAEKRGWHWALTPFILDAWGEAEDETF
jgi:hypothetical protein